MSIAVATTSLPPLRFVAVWPGNARSRRRPTPARRARAGGRRLGCEPGERWGSPRDRVQRFLELRADEDVTLRSEEQDRDLQHLPTVAQDEVTASYAAAHAADPTEAAVEVPAGVDDVDVEDHVSEADCTPSRTSSRAGQCVHIDAVGFGLPKVARTSRKGDRDERALGSAGPITLQNGACLLGAGGRSHTHHQPGGSQTCWPSPVSLGNLYWWLTSPAARHP
jgi:hypothetical protein